MFCPELHQKERIHSHGLVSFHLNFNFYLQDISTWIRWKYYLFRSCWRSEQFMPVQSFLSFLAGSRRSSATFCCLWMHFSGLISKSPIFGVPELSYSLCCLYSCSSGNRDDWVWASRDHCCCSGGWCKKGWIRKDELSAPKLTFWLPKNKTWEKK